MAGSLNIKPKYVLLCDDIRTEVSGKLILIGVYSGDILAANFPLRMKLTTYVAADMLQPGSGTLSIEINIAPDDGSEGQVHVLEAEMEVGTGPSEGGFPMPAVPIAVPGPAALTIRWKLNDSDWAKIASKRIDAHRPPQTE